MARSHHRKPWILVVDDNVDVANGLAMGLRIFDYAVRVRYGGPEGIVAALEDHPDIIILDIGMPILDGFEVARKIRRALGVDALLIAHTAWDDPTTLRRCKEAGFDHHVTKPVSLRSIVDLANKLES